MVYIIWECNVDTLVDHIYGIFATEDLCDEILAGLCRHNTNIYWKESVVLHGKANR